MKDYDAPRARGAGMTPGEQIKQARLAMGLSLRQFARKLGIRRHKSISEMESGKITPAPELIEEVRRLVAAPKKRVIRRP